MSNEDKQRAENRTQVRRFNTGRVPSAGMPLDVMAQAAAKNTRPPILTPNEQARDDSLTALRRQSAFIQSAFIATNAGTGIVGSVTGIIRPAEFRTYFLIQNTAGAGIIYIGFGQSPTPGSALQIAPGGYYEPYQVPQNDIYIFGNVAAVTGILLVALG